MIQDTMRRGIVSLLRVLLGGSVIVMTVLAVLQVILRYVFGAPLFWVDEVSTDIMLWLTWLGAVLLWLESGHMVADLLTTQFPERVQRMIATGTDVAVAITALALFVTSWETVNAFAGMPSPVLPVNLSLKYFPVTVGAAGLFIAAGLNLWRRAQDKRAL